MVYKSKKKMTYHGRCIGYPMIYATKKGREYIIVCAAGRSIKRLYLKKGDVPIRDRE